MAGSLRRYTNARLPLPLPLHFISTTSTQTLTGFV